MVSFVRCHLDESVRVVHGRRELGRGDLDGVRGRARARARARGRGRARAWGRGRGRGRHRPSRPRPACARTWSRWAG